MTSLKRTTLSVGEKIQCAAQTVSEQYFGAISALSRQFGLSRPTVYELKAQTEAILTEHFDPLVSETHTITVDQSQLERAIIALRVMAPNSLRVIEQLLPLLYPGVSYSYGKVQQIVVTAEQQAAQFNTQADLSAIRAAALDELFSQGRPVLAGIDLDSGYLFGLQVCDDRSAQSWAEVLQSARDQGLDLEVVVKDAALGIAAGVSQVFPHAEQRDDCFHARYEFNRVLRRLERQAYTSIEREQAAFKKLGKTWSCHIKLRRQRVREHRRAQRQMDRAIARYDTVAQAAEQLHRALSWVDLDRGELRTAAQVQADTEAVARVLQTIDRDDCRKLSRYLHNRAGGLAAYAAELYSQLTQLAEHYGQQPVELATIMIQLLDDLKARRKPWLQRQNQLQLVGAYHQLTQTLGEQAGELFHHVQLLWQQRHRASSAIEGFNSSLRPYLYVHKSVSQGFLELYRAYFNLRSRRWGRHRGTSALLMLQQQQTDDWLTLLGYPPSHNLT